jgi:type IX secretion system PorP/SprF family membrane protein
MKRLLTYLITITAAATARSQDLHFSQFNEMPILRNPSLAGNFDGQMRALTAYRNQWQTVSVPYKTLAVATEFKLVGDQCAGSNFSLTGGVQYVRDEAGDSRLTRNMYLLSLTGRKQLTRDLYASAGFCGGPVTSNFNFMGLKWSDQYINGQYLPTNPTQQPVPSNGKNYFDLGWGVGVGSNADDVQWYAAYGRFHDNRPKVGFGTNYTSLTVLPVRQSLNAGIAIYANDIKTEVWSFYTDFMWQGTQNQFMAGVTHRWEWLNETGAGDDGKSFTVGAFYRLNDAIVPTINLQLKTFTVGLSYDVNVSRLSAASHYQGGFELTLKFRGVLFGEPQSCGKIGCFH